MNKPLTVLRYRVKRRMKDSTVPASVGNIKITCKGFQSTNLHKHLTSPATIFSQVEIHQWLKIGYTAENHSDSESVFLMLICSVLPVYGE